MKQTDTPANTDRIERSVVIRAPRERVWRALSDAETFGTWFGADLKGQAFRPGERTRGRITITGFEHVQFDVVVERVEPQHLFSYRWHPYNVDAAVDYSQEEPTLVTFMLADAADGSTALTVVETGFDRLPKHRWSDAFRMNGAGWEGQLRGITRYVENEEVSSAPRCK